MIITLCGSARFERQFWAWKKVLGLASHLVFDLVTYPALETNGKDWYTVGQKQILDALHLEKIHHSNAILVLNVCAYIGESTLTEIEHAQHLGRRIYALESWGLGYGIGNNHNSATRERKQSYGIDAAYVSPIDTSDFYSPLNLLGPAGANRSGLLKILEEGDAL